MDTNTELQYLRSRREAEIAISDLETEAASVAKRYKVGVRELLAYITSIDSEIEEGGAMQGMSIVETISPELKQLIADPTLDNVKGDTAV